MSPTKCLTLNLTLVAALNGFGPIVFAQAAAVNVTPNCQANRAGSDCKPVKRIPFQKAEFSAPPVNRKPPKPPKQSPGLKDELPERREDNF